MNIQPTDLRITGTGDVTYRGAPSIRVGKLALAGLRVTATCNNDQCPWTTPEPRLSTAEAIRDLVGHLNAVAVAAAEPATVLTPAAAPVMVPDRVEAVARVAVPAIPAARPTASAVAVVASPAAVPVAVVIASEPERDPAPAVVPARPKSRGRGRISVPQIFPSVTR